MKKNTKNVLRFAGVMIGSLLLGYVVGMLIARLNVEDFSAGQAFQDKMAFIMPAVIWVLNLVLGVWGFLLYGKYKRLRSAQPDNEAVMDQLDYSLSYPLLIGNIALILNMLFYAAAVYFLEASTLIGGTYRMLNLAASAAFLFGFVWIFLLQNKVIRMVREMNPEKKGDILDMRFNQEWLGSCDEAQKLNIYKAGYAGYRAGSFACLVGWMIAFLCMFLFDTGLLAVILVTGIWMVLVVAYTVSGMKNERPKKDAGDD